MALAGLLSTCALVHAQDAAIDPNSLRICAGSPDGNYTWAATQIGDRLKAGKIFERVTIINTAGSLDNLRRLSRGECDMAFSQSDVADLYRLDNPGSLSKLDPFKTIYTEYTQILCPRATGWTSLADLAKARKGGAPVKMIVGADGSGTAETWRAIRQSDEETLGKIERLAEDPDISAASKVKDSKDTCMLWVSGLNSPGMQAANDMSVRTRSQKPSLALISVDTQSLAGIKDNQGQPIYSPKTIEAKEPAKDKPGLYNNLIADTGFFSSSKTITVPAVDAKLMTTKAYKAAIKDKSGRIIQVIEDTAPTIWNRINPGD
jgi:hypothetical protein